MRCQSCSETISSKFAAAISKNSCPFCGDVIISEELQNVLAELHTVFEISKDFPNEVSEWLQANHGLTKIAETQVVVDKEEWELYQKKASFISSGKGQVVKRAGGAGEDGALMDNAEAGQTQFSQRAGVKIPSKSALDYIRSGQGTGAARPEEFIGEEDEAYDVEGSQEPLGAREVNGMDDIFAPNADEDRLVKLMELERRRSGGAKLPSSGEGKVRR